MARDNIDSSSGKDKMISLEDPIVVSNLEMLKLRSGEIVKNYSQGGKILSLPVLMWYKENDMIGDGQILELESVADRASVMMIDRIYGRQIKEESVSRASIILDAVVGGIYGGSSVYYAIGNGGYYKSLGDPIDRRNRLHRDSQKRLFLSRELFNSRYEFSD